jgi:hypothetical protein
MLVRFIEKGPVRAGPNTIFGFVGQYADLDGDDLEAAVNTNMVEIVGDDAADEPVAASKRGRKKATG